MLDTLFSAPTVQTTRRFILKCRAKGCKTALAFDCPLQTETRYTRGFVGVPGSATAYKVQAPIRHMLPEVYCVAHGRRVGWLTANEIKGTVTDCPCDGRCTSARGHSCECSCGGANHGSDYL